MAECKLRDLIALPIAIVGFLLVLLGFTIGSQWIQDKCWNAFVKTIGELELKRKTDVNLETPSEQDKR